MAWVDPPTRAVGDLITAAIWNQDIKANTEFLHSPPRCLVTASTPTTNITSTSKTIGFGSELFDTDAMHASTAKTLLRCNSSGTYLVSGGLRVVYDSTAATYGVLAISKGSTSCQVSRFAPGGQTAVSANGSRLFTMSTGDTMSLQFAAGGANADSATGSTRTWFSALWIGD